jgi:hypothetical protein
MPEAAETVFVISDDFVRQGFEYWRQKAAGRLPSRADIDPTEIPRLLPYIRLVDVIGPGRYRYRLVGTEVQKMHTSTATGHFVEDVLKGPVAARVIEVYDECVRDRRPIYFEIVFIGTDDSQLSQLRRHSKALFLPLSSDGETVDKVMVIQVILSPNRFVKATDPWAGPYTEVMHVPL